MNSTLESQESLSTIDASYDPRYGHESAHHDVFPAFRSPQGCHPPIAPAIASQAGHSDLTLRAGAQSTLPTVVKQEAIEENLRPSISLYRVPESHWALPQNNCILPQRPDDTRSNFLMYDTNPSPVSGLEFIDRPLDPGTGYVRNQCRQHVQAPPPSRRELAIRRCTDFNDVVNNPGIPGETHIRELLASFGQDGCQRLGSGVHIDRPFDCQYGDNIWIGENTSISRDCFIQDEAPVHIGSGCTIGPSVTINTFQADKGPKPITIGNGCQIHGHVAITGGVSIGEYSIIPKAITVFQDVPPYSQITADGQKIIPR